MFIKNFPKLIKQIITILYFITIIAISLDLNINFTLENYEKTKSSPLFLNFRQLNQNMRSILEDLSRQNFFRYFRVDISRDCPFQISDALCTAKTNCQLACECPPDKLPQTWLKEDLKQRENLAFSPIKFYDMLKPHINGNDPWSFDSISNSNIYVDLQTDREQYTGYQGQNIWRIIYEENCIHLSKACGEDNFLYKIISGMHASVSSHLTEYYFDFSESEANIKANELLYHQKVGGFPERLENLAFAVQTLLHAYIRYIDIIEAFPIDTGVFGEDMKTKQLLQKLSTLLRNVKDISFNQGLIFGQAASQMTQKATYLQYFRNITQIMDCVDCVKCKVYGKMQVLGIGVALRIMLKDSAVSLTRNELVAFINTLNKWTESLEIIERMKIRLWKKKGIFFVYMTSLFILLLVLVDVAAWKINQKGANRKIIKKN